MFQYKERQVELKTRIDCKLTILVMYHQQRSVGALIFSTSSDAEPYIILSISYSMQCSWQFENKSCSLNTISWTNDVYDSQAPCLGPAQPCGNATTSKRACASINPYTVHKRRNWIFVSTIVPNIRRCRSQGDIWQRICIFN